MGTCANLPVTCLISAKYQDFRQEKRREQPVSRLASMTGTFFHWFHAENTYKPYAYKKTCNYISILIYAIW